MSAGPAHESPEHRAKGGDGVRGKGGEGRTLVVEELLPRLGGVLGVGRLDNGVDGARLLAEAAVDALGHVDVVAGRPAGPVGALLGLDRDGLGGADLLRASASCPAGCRSGRGGEMTYGLAELAGDAALLARGVPP